MHQSLLSVLCCAAAVAPVMARPPCNQGSHNGGHESGRHSSSMLPVSSSAQLTSELPIPTTSTSEVVAVPTSAMTSKTVAVTTASTSEVVIPTTSSSSQVVVVPTTSSSSQVIVVPTTSSSEVVVVPTTTTSPIEVVSTPSSTSSAAAATTSAVQTATAETLTANYCGAPNAYKVLSNTPWIVYSMNYNYQSISGSCCTGYYSVTGTDNDQTLHWSSIWDIDEAVDTNVVKGYSFIGLTQNLETQLSAISSIPSTYSWTISNTTAYKGNVVYDFMTSDTKGDSTSSAAQELMLWLQYEGGQLPIGWADGAVATIDGLFGKDGWQLYQGKNTDTGITVSSLLVPANDMFDGSFEGDIKDWLLALSEQGVFSTSTYVNVGNAGMEPYWGTVTFDNNLSLRIDL